MPAGELEKAVGYLNAATFALSKAIYHYSRANATWAKREKLKRITRELKAMIDNFEDGRKVRNGQ